ncbi:LysM peptidoglycan-binding domain-containing protein [Rubritalea marina]|uniref:LysM peptidoglycan-binding domain-containing protein n=1 Tax=Rubritalea marina TaxID=361055 RepID=UPI00037A032E|nr:LysM peptidoglycan-binding domain-containing protein [Rubritalea marina]
MKSLVCTAALASATLVSTALADSELEILRERIKQQEETINDLKEKLSKYEATPATTEAAASKPAAPIDIPPPSIDIPAPSLADSVELPPAEVAQTAEAVAEGKAPEEEAKPVTPAKALIVEAAPAYYTVESGDHLTKIARKHDTSVAELLAINPGINPNALRIGQRVNIPASAESKETVEQIAAAAGTKPAPVVEETPAAPADKPAAPKAAIVVEEAPSGPIPYIVQQGDTMFNLSRKHNTTVAAIKAVNPGLDPRKMWAGRKMYLPAPKQAAPQAKPAATPAAAPAPEAPAAPAPAPEPPKVEIPEPAPEPVQEIPEPSAATTGASNEDVKEPLTETASNNAGIDGKITTVKVEKQMTFGEFAAQHQSTVDKINILNGLRLNSDTVLAEGSELYVPQK